MGGAATRRCRGTRGDHPGGPAAADSSVRVEAAEHPRESRQEEDRGAPGEAADVESGGRGYCRARARRCTKNRARAERDRPCPPETGGPRRTGAAGRWRRPITRGSTGAGAAAKPDPERDGRLPASVVGAAWDSPPNPARRTGRQPGPTQWSLAPVRARDGRHRQMGPASVHQRTGWAGERQRLRRAWLAAHQPGSSERRSEAVTYRQTRIVRLLRGWRWSTKKRHTKIRRILIARPRATGAHDQRRRAGQRPVHARRGKGVTADRPCRRSTWSER